MASLWKRIRTFVTVAIVALSFAATVSAAPKGGGGAGPAVTNIPVTSTLHTERNDVPLSLRGDGLGNYVTSKGVNSQIQRFNDTGYTDWFLNMPGAPRTVQRSIELDFSEPDATAVASPPFITELVPATLLLKCTKRNVNIMTMTVGESHTCNLRILYSWNSVGYALGFNTINEYVAPEQQGDDARITCEASGTNGCTWWTIEPAATTTTDGDPNLKARGMHFLDNGGGAEDDIWQGRFHFSFFIEVRR
jgi:hypothetical protein